MAVPGQRAFIPGDWSHLEHIINELFARTIPVIDSDIVTNTSDIVVIKSDVIVNASDIASLRSDVTILQSNVVWLESDTKVNTSDIVVLKSDVATNASDILVITGGPLASDVATNKSDIVVLKSDVVAIQSDLVVITSDIVVLQADGLLHLALDGTRVMTGPIVFGAAPVDTDGNWRIDISGEFLLIEKRIAGTWTELHKFGE